MFQEIARTASCLGLVTISLVFAWNAISQGYLLQSEIHYVDMPDSVSTAVSEVESPPLFAGSLAEPDHATDLMTHV